MPTLIFPRGIVILKDLDKITIENPGSIITGKLQMLKGGISEPRNKIIMKMFNLIRVGERAGSGAPELFSVWDQEGWITPIVEEQFKPDRTILSEMTDEIKAVGATNSRRKYRKKVAKHNTIFDEAVVWLYIIYKFGN